MVNSHEYHRSKGKPRKGEEAISEEQIAAGWVQGLSTKEIAAQHNISPSNITHRKRRSRYLQEVWKQHRKKYRRVSSVDIAKDRNSGTRTKDLAKRDSVVSSAISHRERRNGLLPRRRGKVPKNK